MPLIGVDNGVESKTASPLQSGRWNRIRSCYPQELERSCIYSIWGSSVEMGSLV